MLLLHAVSHDEVDNQENFWRNEYDTDPVIAGIVLENGVAIVCFRINEVSHRHFNGEFCLKIAPASLDDIAGVVSDSVNVTSKSTRRQMRREDTLRKTPQARKLLGMNSEIPESRRHVRSRSKQGHQ